MCFTLEINAIKTIDYDRNLPTLLPNGKMSYSPTLAALERIKATM